MARMPASNEEGAGATELGVAVSSEKGIESEKVKSGKEVALALVRGSRIPLSTDSQGRNLLIIPPRSDGFSPLNKSSMLNEFSVQITVDKVNMLPQQLRIEEVWDQAGPEFQQIHTCLRTYGNTFDAGVVLPRFTGPRPFCAHMHTTTNINKPPDIGVINIDIIRCALSHLPP